MVIQNQWTRLTLLTLVTCPVSQQQDSGTTQRGLELWNLNSLAFALTITVDRKMPQLFDYFLKCAHFKPYFQF